LTIQVPDRLFLDGEECAIVGISLKDCTWPRVRTFISSVQRNSACWRGHYCTWGIQDDRLVLKDLTILASERMVEFHEVFPDCPDGVVADWFSGVIEVPRGENVDLGHDYHMHEEQLVLTFLHGALVSREVRDDRLAVRQMAQKITKLYSKPLKPRSRSLRDDVNTDEKSKSEIEVACDEYMMAAMMGATDNDTRERWRRFYNAVEGIASEEEKLLLDIVKNAIDGVSA
jgi:hypothetical protein